MSITSVKSGLTSMSLALDNNYMEPIATVLVGASGSNVIAFNDIPQTYKHLQIRGIARDNGGSGEDDFAIRLNGDTGTNYAFHYLMGNGTSASSSASSSASRIMVRMLSTAVQNDGFGALIVDILDYTNTNKYKTIRALGGYDVNSSGTVALNSGLWMNTDAVTSIAIRNDRAVNFLQNTRISLYGIKG